MTQNKGYKIGAVSKLTGIPPETLRIWEHRYGIVSPGRGSSGAREYSDSDIKYLSIIKQLLASGDSIGNLANLSITELAERLDGYSKLQRGSDSHGNLNDISSVCVFGPTLPGQLEKYKNETSPINFIGLYSNNAEFESKVQQARPDLLILEYPNILENDIKPIREKFKLSTARYLLIVYRFSSTALVKKLKKDGFLMHCGSVDYNQIMNLCNVSLPDESVNKSSIPGSYRTRVFSDIELSKIATIQTNVNCECPHHLAQILTNLVAFETYSKNCEDSNDDDAKLHAELYDVTASARTAFEIILEKILTLENIDVKNL